MNTKYLLMTITSFIICAVLFCVKITGEAVHSILGLLFIIGLFIHFAAKWNHMIKMPSKIKVIDTMALLSLIMILLTGVMMHPTNKALYVIAAHGIFSILFVVVCIIHVIQHIRRNSYNS